jgi:hypothetical protein
MLLTPLTMAAGRMVRRGLRGLGGDDAAAWAIRVPLVTLVLAGLLAAALRRP